MATRDNLYILELFSGHGTVARVAQHILECPIYTIDKDPATEPSLCLDLTQWSKRTHGKLLKDAFPNRLPIIFASPPCEHFSQARTTGAARDLEAANRNVDMVRRIQRDLDAIMVFVENPRTGLLKGQDVIKFLPECYEVDYCQYGFLYRKQTLIWCSHALLTFVPKKCPKGLGGCLAKYKHAVDGQVKHVLEFNKVPLEDRIRVPDQLVASLVIAALPVLSELMSATQKRKQREYEVEVINNMREQNGELELNVKWKGYDAATWEPLSAFTAPLDTYAYKTSKLKKQVLKHDKNG